MYDEERQKIVEETKEDFGDEIEIIKEHHIRLSRFIDAVESGGISPEHADDKFKLMYTALFADFFNKQWTALDLILKGSYSEARIINRTIQEILYYSSILVDNPETGCELHEYVTSENPPGKNMYNKPLQDLADEANLIHLHDDKSPNTQIDNGVYGVLSKDVHAKTSIDNLINPHSEEIHYFNYYRHQQAKFLLCHFDTLNKSFMKTSIRPLGSFEDYKSLVEKYESFREEELTQLEKLTILNPHNYDLPPWPDKEERMMKWIGE